VVNPAELPDALDAEPGYGLVRSIVFGLIYAALLVGVVIYLVRKLPREDDLPPSAPGDRQ
jgi:hypothetical protein